MLYYWIHIVFLYLGRLFFWKRVRIDEDISRQWRVSLLDCEAMRYMSNSKYFYYMDFIRFEILFRSTLNDVTFKKRIYPVLGSQKIIYRKPLKRWTKFKITLKLEGWDDKWVYHRQIFERNGEVYAIGITKVGFWKNKKVLNMPQIIADCGVTLKEKAPSREVINMFDGDHDFLHQNESVSNL